MRYGIDAIVGPYRAAELVNEYRALLRSDDNLSDRAALAVACTAYADSYIYALAASGQVWESVGGSETGAKERVSIIERSHDSVAGHYVKVSTACGVVEYIPLDRLAEHYFLFSWPEPQAD